MYFSCRFRAKLHGLQMVFAFPAAFTGHLLAMLGRAEVVRCHRRFAVMCDHRLAVHCRHNPHSNSICRACTCGNGATPMIIQGSACANHNKRDCREQNCRFHASPTPHFTTSQWPVLSEPMRRSRFFFTSDAIDTLTVSRCNFNLAESASYVNDESFFSAANTV